MKMFGSTISKTHLLKPLPVYVYNTVSPEDVVDAGVTKTVSTLSLSWLTEDQPAGLTAVFGLWSLDKVISESSVKRLKTCRDT